MHRWTRRSAVTLLAAAIVGAPGCGDGKGKAVDANEAAPAPASAVDEAKPAKKPPEPLTQEELDLIAADPATLTPARRRDRAFALRKKIMQNPDSPAAQSLDKIRSQIESGELKPQLPDRGITFSARLPADKTAPPGDAPTKDAPTKDGATEAGTPTATPGGAR